MDVTIQTLFKIYLSLSFILFFFTYSKKHKIFEKLNLISFMIGSFCLLSFRSELIVFCSMALMLISSYGFALTRIRPNKYTITAVALSAILILLYKVTPHISVIMLLLFIISLCFAANEKSIEAFIVLFILPVILYLCIDYTSYNNSRLLFPMVTRVTGLAFIVVSSFVLLSRKFENKKMISYAFFYIGHYIFAIGVKTPESITLAVMFTFIMPFIYSSEPDFISVFNLSMLPVSPVFILKTALVMIVIKANMLPEAAIIVGCSLIVMVLCVSDLSNIVFRPFKRKAGIPVLIQTVSVAVLLLSIIYLDTVKNVIKITIKVING
ncbi:MAG: hypothetical protein NTY22_07130 [Proteobacteria bacterium]|nr:hypothetical protein [Pseudomonadota bacterium]